MPERANTLTRLKQLSGTEWRLLLAASFLLPWCAFLLKRHGYQTTRQKLAHLRSRRVASPTDAETAIRRIARMVDIAARRGWFRTDCLKKALATWVLAGRSGIDCDIRIGVDKPGDSLEAHAWVEYQGEVVSPEPGNHERFSPLT